MAARRTAFIVCLIVLSTGVNVWFRLNTARLPKFDQLAREEVYAGVNARIAGEVARAHPGLNEADRAAFVKRVFREYRRQDAAALQRAVRERARQLKSFLLDDQGWPYLLENDSYRWMRRVANLLRSGHSGTRREDGRDYDELMAAPSRDSLVERQPLHFFLGAQWYKFLRAAGMDIELRHALAVLPVVLTVFMVTAIFILSRLAGVSYAGAWAASIAAGLARPVLMRTSLGWYDTDSYNVFMPAFIVACAACALSGPARRRRRIAAACGGGILVGVYSALWNVWWISVYLVFAGLLIYAAVSFISNWRSGEWKRAVSVTAIFVLSACAAVWLMSGPDILWKLVWEPWWDWSIKRDVALEGFWPGISFSVVEIRPLNLMRLVEGIGGLPVLCIAAAGMVWCTASLVSGKQPRAGQVMLLVWAAGMALAALSAERFLIFLLAPAGVFFGKALDEAAAAAARVVRRYGRGFFARHAGAAAGFVFIAGASLPVFPARSVSFISHNNDAWQEFLGKMDEMLPRDAVVAADWPLGDWVMTTAGRATLTCAGWQHTPIPYWIARALLTSDERESRGILRMLNAGGNGAFEALAAVCGGDRLKALDAVNALVKLERGEGLTYLRSLVRDESAAQRVCGLIYDARRPGYLLVHHLQFASLYENDTLASWDFRRYMLWDKFLTTSHRDLDGTGDDTLRLTTAQNVLGWIAPRTRLMIAPFAAARAPENGGMAVFDNGVVYDTRSREACWRNPGTGDVIRAGLTKVISAGGSTARENPAGDREYCVFVFEKGGLLDAVVLNRALAESVFSRLYFLKGEGLTLFKKTLEAQQSEYDVMMFAYKIVWDGIEGESK